MGVGSPGVRRGEGVTLALTTSVGQDSDTSWMQVAEGREPRPSEQEVLDPRPELSMGEK